jgi:anti-sigma B factor antagonist
VIIRPLDRDTDVAPVPDGGSDAAVITAERAAEPAQLELSCRTAANGYQIVSVAGELDIATAEQVYSYLSEVIDGRTAPVTVDLSGLTFCDASGLGVLARAARYARQKGRQLALASARPSLLKIMRITGLDRAFPELHPPAHAYSALPIQAGIQARRAKLGLLAMEDTAHRR